MSLFELEKGGWVKLVNGNSVINGTIRQATATYVQVEGLYPLPLKDWKPIIVKPAPIRKADNGSNG